MTDRTARPRADFWIDPAHDPRNTDELPVGETATLRQYLDQYRITFKMKCDCLSPEQMATRWIPPSTMSLLGLVRHLARIEHHWFRRTLDRQPDLPFLYFTDADPPLGLDGAVATDDCVADAWGSRRREVAHAREVYAQYGDVGKTFIPGEPWTVRGVTVHMIEDYARH